MISIGPGMRDCIVMSPLAFEKVKFQVSAAKEVPSSIAGIRLVEDPYLPDSKAVMFDSKGNITILSLEAVEGEE